MSKANYFVKIDSLFLVFVIYALNFNVCDCGEHLITGLQRTGHSTTNSAKNFTNYTLFTRNSTTPKSYTVKYKYVADALSGVIHSGRINSNAEDTWGSGDLSNGNNWRGNRHLNARIDILNSTNFWVNVTVRGTPGVGHISAFDYNSDIKMFRPRSSALICLMNAERPRSQYRRIEFGTRRPGDFLVRASKQSVISQSSKLPRYLIEFIDEGVILTSVIIKLNTTQAIIFNNKVIMTEHWFSSTVYGLKQSVFTVIYIIYGHKI